MLINTTLTTIRNIVIALLALSLIIVIHEFGHFIACKIFDVKTPVFSIGFPPVIASKQIGQTSFQIGALPLGGYVSIDQTDFKKLNYIKKLIIILAGIVFNFLFTVIVFTFLSRREKIVHESDSEDENKLAIKEPKPKWFNKIFAKRKTKGEFVGPIGIINLIGKSVDLGLEPFLYLLAVISLNIGLFNVLPIPFLDGGQAFAITIEALYGKELSPSVMNLIYLLFLLLFILLTSVLSIRDIKKIRNKKE